MRKTSRRPVRRNPDLEESSLDRIGALLADVNNSLVPIRFVIAASPPVGTDPEAWQDAQEGLRQVADLLHQAQQLAPVRRRR